MNNQKLQNIFGCLGLLLLGLIVLFIMGLSFGFVPPISTWGPSLRVAMVDRNTVEGDSLYLACLKEKADLLEKKGDKSLVMWVKPSGNKEFVVCSYYNSEKPVGSQWCWGHYFSTVTSAVEYLKKEG